jgi:hypothetical protein
VPRQGESAPPRGGTTPPRTASPPPPGGTTPAWTAGPPPAGGTTPARTASPPPPGGTTPVRTVAAPLRNERPPGLVALRDSMTTFGLHEPSTRGLDEHLGAVTAGHGVFTPRRRPYVLLSCAMSLDGYVDDDTDERLVLSNSEDLDRVDAMRAECDAILVGANTIRRDNPRLMVRDAERRERRAENGLPPLPAKVAIFGHGDVDPQSRFFTDGVPQPGAAGRAGHGGRRRGAGRPRARPRGPGPARGAPAAGRGRQHDPHTVPHGRAGRRTATGGRALLRR